MVRLYVVPAIAALLAAGCGSDASAPLGSNAGKGSEAPTGSVTVFAAASLTESFEDARKALATTAPGLEITYSFAGSGTLVQQVRQGAPADVIATADASSMQTLVDAELVEPPTTFAHNKLEILVAPGNPKQITSLSDLSRADLIVVLCDPSVPAGRYANQALQQASVRVRAKSLEPDVKAAVARVTSGEADATIVYVTDVKAAGSKGTGVEIPDSSNVLADYPIAVVRDTDDREAANAFVDEVLNGAGRDALAARGFSV